MPRIDLIKLRRGTAAQWTSANPVLADGEYGFETDTLQSKIGNGTDNWNDLSYLSGATPDEQQIFSDLTEDNTVSGTYTFNFDNSRRKVLEMTADTDFSVESLVIGKAAAFNVTLTGDFAPTWLSTTVTPTSDTYDGTIDNRLTFDCYKKADGTQVNILTIENLS